MEPRPVSLTQPEPSAGGYLKPRHLWLMALTVISVLGGLGLVYLRPEMMIAAAIGVPVAVVLLTRPFVGLLLLIGIMVVQPGELETTLAAFHVERVAALMVLLSVVLECRRAGRGIQLAGHPMLTAMYVFLAAVVLSLASSIWISGTIDTIQILLRTLVYCLLIINVLRTPRRITLFVRFFMLLHAYVALMTLKGYYSGQIMFAQGISRAVGLTSFGGDPNALAATLVAAMPFFILGMRVERLRRWKALWGACLLACLWTVVLTGSRSGFLGLLCLAVLFWLMSRRKALTLVMALAVLAVTWTVLPAQYQTRYLTLTNGQLDESSMGRIDAWKAGLRMFLDRPLLGVGAGNFSAAHAMQAREGEVRHWLKAHSLYVQLLAELGIVGVLGFGFFVLRFYKVAWGYLRRFPVISRSADYRGVVVWGSLVAFTGLLLSGLFGHNLYRITWYLLAALLVVSGEARPEADARPAAPLSGVAPRAVAPSAAREGGPRA